MWKVVLSLAYCVCFSCCSVNQLYAYAWPLWGNCCCNSKFVSFLILVLFVSGGFLDVCKLHVYYMYCLCMDMVCALWLFVCYAPWYVLCKFTRIDVSLDVMYTCMSSLYFILCNIRMCLVCDVSYVKVGIWSMLDVCMHRIMSYVCMHVAIDRWMLYECMLYICMWCMNLTEEPARGNQRDRDRERALARASKKHSGSAKKDDLTPEQRRERWVEISLLKLL